MSVVCLFFFKQKTAYEMLISDWSSDVCSSDRVVTEIVAVSVGEAKCQETLRTALAMGADRAILVQTDDRVEPLGVAKLLAKIVEEEAPELVILGKQEIGRAHV